MKMKVLKIEPLRKPEIVEIDNGLDSLQKAVDGYIEVTYPFDDPVGIVCNEEGKMNGMRPNRGLYADGELYDILFGTFLIVGLGEEDFASLTDDQLRKYEQIFHTPQEFMRLFNGQIVAMEYHGEDM